MAQSDDLVEIALERYRLGRNLSDEPYAVPKVGSSVARLLRGSSAALRSELANEYHSRQGKVPTSNALTEALTVIEGRCLDAAPQDVYLRVAHIGADIFVDLGQGEDDESEPFVHIRDGTWNLVPVAPVLFRRTKLTSAMPTPRRGGSVDALRQLVNLSESDFRLLVGWLVAAFFPNIPHPVLVIMGPQGTGKSTVERFVAQLVDPSPAPLRSAPRSDKDFAVAANSSYCIPFDNMSGITDRQSDLFCRAATGDAHVSRSLYTNSDVSVMQYKRLMILNGIDPGVVQGDLVDRSLFLELSPFEDRERRLDQELHREFKQVHPEVLGALFDLTAMTLMTLDSLHLDALPRMADFAQILAALDEIKGWSTYHLYRQKIQGARIDSIDSDPVAVAIVELLDRQGPFTGTAGTLLAKLDAPSIGTSWPSTPKDLSNRLKRAEPALTAIGINVFRTRSSTERIIEIKRAEDSASSPSPSSPLVPSARTMEDEAVANVMKLFPDAQVVQ
jgi:hypothetical protein